MSEIVLRPVRWLHRGDGYETWNTKLLRMATKCGLALIILALAPVGVPLICGLLVAKFIVKTLNGE